MGYNHRACDSSAKASVQADVPSGPFSLSQSHSRLLYPDGEPLSILGHSSMYARYCLYITGHENPFKRSFTIIVTMMMPLNVCRTRTYLAAYIDLKLYWHNSEEHQAADGTPARCSPDHRTQLSARDDTLDSSQRCMTRGPRHPRKKNLLWHLLDSGPGLYCTKMIVLPSLIARSEK